MALSRLTGIFVSAASVAAVIAVGFIGKPIAKNGTALASPEPPVSINLPMVMVTANYRDQSVLQKILRQLSQHPSTETVNVSWLMIDRTVGNYTNTVSYNRRNQTLTRTLTPENPKHNGDEVTYQDVSESKLTNIAKSGLSIPSALKNHRQTSASLNYSSM